MTWVLVLSGTPIKVIISGGALKVDDVKVVVLDEADEILSRGFREHVHNGMHYGMYVCTVGMYVYAY